MNDNEYQTMFEVENTHFWYKGMRKISKILLDKYISKKTQYKILDAGCGTGGNMSFLRRYGHVRGIDISSQAIQFCKRRGLRNIYIGSIDHIPFSSNSFDIITCFDVLGQKDVSNDLIAVQEFYRVLKPGGILLIRVAAYTGLYSYHDIAVHTERRYGAKTLIELLKKGNFQIKKITYANTFFFPIIALFRLFYRFFSQKDKYNSDVRKINSLLNKILYYPLWIESKIIKYISIHYGLSLIGVAKK